jgi:multiple sugar transport system substrate-binding protein
MDAPLYPDWQSRGVLLNLQPYIDKTPGFLDGFYPATLENYQRTDGYYGMPRDFQTIVMFYNKDMFDAAGVAYPAAGWTYDDFRQTAKKLILDSNNDGTTEQWGFGTDLWDMELFWSSAIWAHGGEIVNAERTKTLLGEPKGREAWQMIDDIIHVDKSMPDIDTAAQFGYDLFAAGKVAMWPIGHWVVPEYSVLGFKWDVAPMPSGPAGQATSANSAGFVVSKDTKHPEESWKFIQYALGPTGQASLTELGFAIPVLKSVAESPVFLEQKSVQINQKVFLDSMAFAHVKPAFKGYDEWASIFGDGLLPVWNGQADLNATLDTLVPQGDAVLAKNK